MTDKKLFYVSFIGNYSRESVIYPMSLKDQVFKKYKLYKAMMLWQWDVCVKTLFSDQGGEYTSKEFEDYLARKGTKHRLTYSLFLVTKEPFVKSGNQWMGFYWKDKKCYEM